MCFREFSSRLFARRLNLSVLEGERTALEPDEKRHIRSVGDAFEHADGTFFDLASAAEVERPEGPHAVADFHGSSFSGRDGYSSKVAAVRGGTHGI
jgi:hypothetical protein